MAVFHAAPSVDPFQMFLHGARADVEDRADEMRCRGGLRAPQRVYSPEFDRLQGVVGICVAIARELTPTVETGYAPAGARSRDGFRPAGNLYRLIPLEQSNIVAR